MRTICRAIKLNPSTYYAARKTKLSKRALLDQVLRTTILNIYITAKKRFGAYKINNKLREQGLFISIGKCYRLLANMDLPTIYTQKPTFKRSVASNDLECPDLIKRNFKTDAPNKAWVSDITYVKLNGKFAYICVIIDLFARKVIAYTSRQNMKKELVMDTLLKALKNRNFPKGVIFHSDRGSQYTSKQFRQMIDKYDLKQSFSRPGCPYDNAVAENFFRYFKQGELNRKTFAAISELELSTFEYIESYYNVYNPHSFNNGLTPNAAEQNYFSKAKKAKIYINSPGY